MDYQEGDAVRVKAGTACPDAPDLDISGWQGRITDLSQADNESEPVNRRRGQSLRRPGLVPQRLAALLLSAGRSGRRG